MNKGIGMCHWFTQLHYVYILYEQFLDNTPGMPIIISYAIIGEKSKLKETLNGYASDIFTHSPTVKFYAKNNFFPDAPFFKNKNAPKGSY